MARPKTKQKKNQHLTVTVGAIENLRQQSTVKAVRLTHYFPLLVLRDTFGFGHTRLTRFQEQYLAVWDAYNTSQLNVPTIARELKHEANLDLHDFQDTKDTKHKYPNQPDTKKVLIKKRELDQIQTRSLHDAFVVTSHIPLYVLKHEFGFGETRLRRFLTRYLELWDSYSKGYLSVQDIADVLEQEVNITWIEEE